MLTVVIAVAVLGVLVTTHELGHFLIAKACRIRVLRFSIGFGPRLVGFTRGGTEYVICIIPLGGYVKMAGEQPTSEEEEEEEEEEGDQRRGSRFSEKAVPIRAAVVAAGPAMNYLLAIVIFTGFFWFMGAETITTRIVGIVNPDSPAEKAGILPGDELLALDRHELSDWENLAEVLGELPAGPAEIRFRRGAAVETTTVKLPPAEDGWTRLGVGPYWPPVVGTVQRGGVAARGGLEEGDRIIFLDDHPISDWDALVEIIHSSPGKEISFVWLRNGETLSTVMTPETGTAQVGADEVAEVGLIGISPHIDRRRLSFVSSITGGWRQANWYCSQVIAFLRHVSRGNVSWDMVGGPIFIGQLAGRSYRWGWEHLLNFVAILSVNLALLNLLPIPILDGGQLLLLVPEGILRRRLSTKQRLVLQQIGLVLVIGLMLIVTARDVLRVIQR